MAGPGALAMTEPQYSQAGLPWQASLGSWVLLPGYVFYQSGPAWATTGASCMAPVPCQDQAPRSRLCAHLLSWTLVTYSPFSPKAPTSL